DCSDISLSESKDTVARSYKGRRDAFLQLLYYLVDSLHLLLRLSSKSNQITTLKTYSYGIVVDLSYFRFKEIQTRGVNGLRVLHIHYRREHHIQSDCSYKRSRDWGYGRGWSRRSCRTDWSIDTRVNHIRGCGYRTRDGRGLGCLLLLLRSVHLLLHIGGRESGRTDRTTLGKWVFFLLLL
ncbi:hypothetical protein PENTCL1PPCAC_20894, partial [Pristionchus entomophagus]